MDVELSICFFLIMSQQVEYATSIYVYMITNLQLQIIKSGRFDPFSLNGVDQY